MPRDAGMAEEDAKVHLVSALNQDTLACLDAYVTMHSAVTRWPTWKLSRTDCTMRPLRPNAGVFEVRRAK